MSTVNMDFSIDFEEISSSIDTTAIAGKRQAPWKPSRTMATLIRPLFHIYEKDGKHQVDHSFYLNSVHWVSIGISNNPNKGGKFARIGVICPKRAKPLIGCNENRMDTPCPFCEALARSAGTNTATSPDLAEVFRQIAGANKPTLAMPIIDISKYRTDFEEDAACKEISPDKAAVEIFEASSSLTSKHLKPLFNGKGLKVFDFQAGSILKIIPAPADKQFEGYGLEVRNEFPVSFELYGKSVPDVVALYEGYREEDVHSMDLNYDKFHQFMLKTFRFDTEKGDFVAVQSPGFRAPAAEPTTFAPPEPVGNLEGSFRDTEPQKETEMKAENPFQDDLPF